MMHLLRRPAVLQWELQVFASGTADFIGYF